MAFNIRNRSRGSSLSSQDLSTSTTSDNTKSSRTTQSSILSSWSKAQSKLVYKAPAVDEQRYKERRDKMRAMTFTDAMAPVTKGAVATGDAIAAGSKATGTAVVAGSKATGSAVTKGAKASGSAIATSSKKASSAIANGSKLAGKKISEAGTATKADISRRAKVYKDKVLDMDNAKLDAEFWATSVALGVVLAGPVIVVGALGAGAIAAGVGVVGGAAGAAVGAAVAAAPVVGGVFVGQVAAKNLSKNNLKTWSKKAGQELSLAGSGLLSVSGLRKLGKSAKASQAYASDFLGSLGEGVSSSVDKAKEHAAYQAKVRSLMSEMDLA